MKKTLESSLESKEINQSILKEINPEYSLEGRMLQLQYFGHFWLFQKSRLIWKDPDDRKKWRYKEKGMAEDEMFGWYHWPNGHEFEQALGDGEGQEILVCCSS